MERNAGCHDISYSFKGKSTKAESKLQDQPEHTEEYTKALEEFDWLMDFRRQDHWQHTLWARIFL